MKKWVCPVCGYVHEGDTPPEFCPQCKVPGSKFMLQADDKTWAAEHVVGVGKQFGADVPAEVQEEIISGLRANFEGECSEVGMYLAMGRVAAREGYPEIALYWEKAAYEEAEHAAKFAELPRRDHHRLDQEESPDACRRRERCDRRQVRACKARKAVQSRRYPRYRPRDGP